MIELTINTYYNHKCGVSEMSRTMPEEVAYELKEPENAAIWEQLISAARANVAKEIQEEVVRALQGASKETLTKCIYVNMKETECEGYLSPEEDYAQTTLKYTTPFLFDIDRFMSLAKTSKETREFTFGVTYMSYGKKTIDIPARIKTTEEAMAWVKDHWDEVSLPEDAEYIPGSDEPDFDENCELEGC